jgi:hypothetical protein
LPGKTPEEEISNAAVGRNKPTKYEKEKIVESARNTEGET